MIHRLMFWLLLAVGAHAQPPAVPPAAAASAEPRVLGLTGQFQLDSIIAVNLEHLDAWATKNDSTKLVPYINGRAIFGTYPEAIDVRENTLQFHLEITSANRAVWIDLLGSPSALREPASFSVGLENQPAFATELKNGKRPLLTVIAPTDGLVSLAVIAGTLLVFIWLARTTSLIRDSGPAPAGGKLKPYNLGRAQMAFWFFLTYVSYVVIWLITDDLDTITPALLGLMGISAGTALSEVLIDTSKDSATTTKLQDLAAEKLALEQSLPALQTQVAALAPTATAADDAFARNNLNSQLLEKRTRLAQLAAQLTELAPAAGDDASRGFLRDILSDGDGYSFHRFQIFAWTIVLGIIFVSTVYNNLTMPAFSATLLGLMGMSSGTYIGFKFPEAR